MKKIIVLITIALLSFKVNAQHPQPLMDEMRTLFVETLKNNHYTGNSEEEIIKSFFADYENIFNNKDFTLEIDAKKFKTVNKKLSQRDASHFYYFYRDFIFSEGEFKMAEQKGMPVSRAAVITTHGGKALSDEEAEKIMNICINQSFINEVSKNNAKHAEYLTYCLDVVGETSFAHAIFYLLNDDSKAETANVATVISWKYLCKQAGVPFYIK
ncbi:MAG: hypothetical protein ACK5IJ_03965 [Mangrovibacterium sp.]